jgi:GTP 3',8-cyclase
MLQKVSNPFMMDSLGRKMRKLRLSLLDACNFRCVYCMPESAKFLPGKNCLTSKELVRISSHFVSFGIEEIRLTGGEPTLRKDLLEIAEGLSDLPLKKLAMTTNALKLRPLLHPLSGTKCKNLNISLDSLDRRKFHSITKMDALPILLDTIDLAQDLGFKIKLNTVVMKGMNDNEIEDFVRFSEERSIEVRFLETMNIGVVRPHFERWFMSAQEMIQKISDNRNLVIRPTEKDSTWFGYETDKGGKIGFIASESKPFCNGCSRLRLDAMGVLRPCLFKEEGLDFRGLSIDEFPEKIKQVVALKPAERIKELLQPMYQVGG